jgi:uncharacterized protein YbaP (TraB family)
MGRLDHKRVALTALAVTALFGSAAAADPPAWRVTAESGAEMWLLGSVHYLRENDYPLPPVVDALYEQAGAIVMELDLDDLDPAELQTVFLAAALLPDDTTLEERLDTDVYERTRAIASTLGLQPALLERFEPWFAAVTLLDLGLQRRGIRADSGVERYLLARTADDGKAVLGLETVRQQVAVFDGLSADEQQGLLEQTLEEMETLGGSIDELIDAWRDGELDVLAEELAAEFERFPELYEALVVARNRAWIDALEAHLEAPEPRLVVVGALHLIGEHSVVDLLRERGLSVEPVAVPQ